MDMVYYKLYRQNFFFFSIEYFHFTIFISFFIYIYIIYMSIILLIKNLVNLFNYFNVFLELSIENIL